MEEARALQINADPTRFGLELKDLVHAQLGSLELDKFREGVKVNHPLATEKTGRLLRHTAAADGPVKR